MHYISYDLVFTHPKQSLPTVSSFEYLSPFLSFIRLLSFLAWQHSVAFILFVCHVVEGISHVCV